MPGAADVADESDVNGNLMAKLRAKGGRLGGTFVDTSPLLLAATGAWSRQPSTAPLADFEPICWRRQTSPHSCFAQSLVCSPSTDSRRLTLNDRTRRRRVGGEREDER